MTRLGFRTNINVNHRVCFSLGCRLSIPEKEINVNNKPTKSAGFHNTPFFEAKPVSPHVYCAYKQPVNVEHVIQKCLA